MYISYKILYGTATKHGLGFFFVAYLPPQTFTHGNGYFSVKIWNGAPKLLQHTQKTVVYKLDTIMDLY